MKRFFHFLLAAVAALTILFVSLSVTASAESDISTSTDYDKDISFGTLKNYSCIKLSYSSEIDYLCFRNLYYGSSSPYMIFSLFGVDSTGKLQHISSMYGEKYTYNTYTGFKVDGISDGSYNDKLYKYKAAFRLPSESSTCFFTFLRSNFNSDNFSNL